MKYKVINKTTKEEYLCDKVIINGFDYYVSDNEGNLDYFLQVNTKRIIKYHPKNGFLLQPQEFDKKVIATNNPNIDIPKVIDEAAIQYTLNNL